MYTSANGLAAAREKIHDERTTLPFLSVVHIPFVPVDGEIPFRFQHAPLTVIA